MSVEHPKVTDLMAALERSVAGAKAARRRRDGTQCDSISPVTRMRCREERDHSGAHTADGIGGWIP